MVLLLRVYRITDLQCAIPSETYKPKLEDILNDIVVITEVAELASEASALSTDDLESEGGAAKLRAQTNSQSKRGPNDVRWSAVKFKPLKTQRNKSETTEESEDADDDDDNDDASNTSSLSESNQVEAGSEEMVSQIPIRASPAFAMSEIPTSGISVGSKTSRESSKIRRLLDKWLEPMNKLDKVSLVPRCCPSISKFISTQLTQNANTDE